jgi:hypothetical protein
LICKIKFNDLLTPRLILLLQFRKLYIFSNYVIILLKMLALWLYMWYCPDFDSLRGQKEAATLVNKGIAAFICLHKYVGNSSFFTFCQNIFYFTETLPFPRKIDTESIPDGIGDLASVIEQVQVVLLI